MAAEKPPSLGKWSDKPQAADAIHAVKRDVEYKLLSDPDEVVDPDQRVKAYQVSSGCSGASGCRLSSFAVHSMVSHAGRCRTLTSS